MRPIEIDLFDSTNVFHKAIHHLHLAAVMFDALSPEQFEGILGVLGSSLPDFPDGVQEMLAPITARMKTEAWLNDWKQEGAKEMLPVALDDPKGDEIWDRYAAEIRSRLSAAGYSEEIILDQIGDMGSVLHEMRDANRPKKRGNRRGKAR